MILAPGAKTKRVPYQRCTTFVGALENTYPLMEWKQRQTVLGMGQREDLVLAAAAVDPSDTKALKDIAEKAFEQSKGSSAARVGTALHQLTERVDTGQELGHVPAEHAADIDAYRRATAHLSWDAIESFRVHDDFQVAGTADRIGMYHGQRTIFDIKTGKIDYPHKMAMQLAMYARSIPYDITSDKRGVDPTPINLNTGVIIHLPAGEGTCDLYEIDIAAGWGACLIARKVWQWRAQKQLIHKVGDPRETVWEKSNQPTLVEKAAVATSLDELRDLWATAKRLDQLTEDFRAAAQERSETLQTQ